MYLTNNDDYSPFDPDGIEEMEEEGSKTEDVYDLSGRKLPKRPLQKGVYIIGGKKVAVK